MMPLIMLTLMMIPAGLKSAKSGNHDNYIVDNDDIVDADVNDDT